MVYSQTSTIGLDDPESIPDDPERKRCGKIQGKYKREPSFLWISQYGDKESGSHGHSSIAVPSSKQGHLKHLRAKNDPSRKGSCKVFTGTQAAMGGAASRAPCVHTRPQGKTILQQCLAEKTQN